MRKLALLCCSTLFALALVEIGLRCFAPIPYSMALEYEADGRVGARLAANRQYVLASGETCSVNNLGFRGTRPMSVRKPAGRVRVVAMGGSSTFSYNVGDGHTWPEVLEASLRKRYGDHIDVINAGMPGFSINDTVYNYPYQVRELQPDIVLAYHTWNDLKSFPWVQATGQNPRKGFLHEPWYKRVGVHLQTAWRIRNFYHATIVPRARENAFAAPPEGMPAVYPNDGAAMRWERQNFEDFTSVVERDSVLPILTTEVGLLTQANLHDPGVRQLIYTEYTGMSFDQLLDVWQRVDSTIAEVAAAHAVPFVDLHQAIPHDIAHLEDHVHLTALGCAAVGERLAEEMARLPRVDRLLRLSQASIQDAGALPRAHTPL